MSYIPDCRTDDAYNEAYLGDCDAEFISGFDWCVQEGLNNAFENIEELASDYEGDAEDVRELVESAADVITADNIMVLLSERPDLMEKIQAELNHWIEMERDELITSMIDNMDDVDYEQNKALCKKGAYKNRIFEVRSVIGSPFDKDTGE